MREMLCLRLVKTQLVKLAREATQRRECTDDYGTQAECEALMRDIEKAHGVDSGPRQHRAGNHRAAPSDSKKVAKYRGPNDTSPTADSIAFSEGDVISNDPQGVTAARMPNVLAEDTWDLFRILLR